MKLTNFDALTSLCKQRAFIFPGSEIYGGLANTWDYGPYGIALKRAIANTWWKFWVEDRGDIVGLDAAILMHPKVWEASGHVAGFSDPLVDCKKCKTRHRGDKLLEEKLGVEAVAGIKLADVQPRLITEQIKCPDCGAIDWDEAKQFNLMFKTQQGTVEGRGTDIYLRPETAQGQFVDFKTIQQGMRLRLPFGIAQIGKSFRNEITPGNFIFRTREFEQMEIEYFCKPDNWKPVFDDLAEGCWEFYTQLLGVKEENLRWRKHDDEELSHYSSLTKDIEYLFPHGWGELMGIAYRGNFDLTQHQTHSGESLEYLDPETNEKYLPHCVEPAFGLTRAVLTVLADAYDEDELGGEKRKVLRFHPRVAPVQVAVLPLSKKEQLATASRDIWKKLKGSFRTEYDESGSIGKRYRRQDEIGTPWCITVDFGTIGEQAEGQSPKGFVTLRNRDTGVQEHVAIEKLTEVLREKMGL